MKEKEAKRLVVKFYGGVPFGDEEKNLSDHGKWLLAQGYLECLEKVNVMVADIRNAANLKEVMDIVAKWEEEK